MHLKQQLCKTGTTISKSGQELLQVEHCSGRPSTYVNVEVLLKVRELVRGNWWITIGEVANEVGVLCGSLKEVLTDELWLTQLCAMFVL